MNQRILIIDFGSQYTQLIARRVRELNIYSEIVPFNNLPDNFDGVKGIIFSGSPFSVLDSKAPQIDVASFPADTPILGVCYGAQYIAHNNGGEVSASNKREYGKAKLSEILTPNPLLDGIAKDSQVWMSHGDTITELPSNGTLLASTSSIKVAAYKMERDASPVYGIQFHPEVYHSLEGLHILKNFTVDICGCQQDWTPASFVEETVESLKAELGDDKVVLGLSGGVDSSVAGILLHKAIGANLHCIFVNNGVLRKDEFKEVLDSYLGLGLNVKGVDASEDFLSELDGISDPETKRKTIGRVFVEVFEREAQQIDGAKWLGQGTIYPDVIESVSVHGPSATIKSHHNVGGLPEQLGLKVIEPLKFLFKDEVRRVGIAMGMPDHLIQRHPFPGPGLAIRIIGEVNKENVRILQEADAIYIRHLRESGWYDKVWQAGTILLPIHTVGVMGDERTYERVVALRAVSSTDGMTAEWSRLPHDLLAEISTDIINHVKGINRVVYDISTKPPSTIEWE